jgi:hypothetical protein
VRLVSWWDEVIIGVPKVTWRKLEQLVEEVVYLEIGESVSRQSRYDFAQQLAVKVLTEYVQERYDDAIRSVAEDFKRKRRDKLRFDV